MTAEGVSSSEVHDELRTAELLLATLRRGNTILICGNGGSAAMAQHFAAELLGRFRHDRAPFAAVALSADMATITAIANDYDYAEIFARQVAAIGRPGDALVVLSASGNSPNVVAAAGRAHSLGIGLVSFTGAADSLLAAFGGILVQAPADDVARIQEMHLIALHVVCNALEHTLTPRKGSREP
jgi:D-sedoheptulose 7-phosphate isomerase